MNTELQKSMQVTGMVGSLDGYMLMVLGIMIFAGILGGIANYFLSDRQGELSSRDGVKYAVLGVIAALTVPLFLNMLSSNLLEAARTRPVDFFVFAGFCLIYVVASRRLFENAANKLLSQIDQVKRDVNHLKQQKREASAPAVMREEAPVVAQEADALPQQHALAGAAGADEGYHLAPWDGETHAPVQPVAAQAGMDILGFQHEGAVDHRGISGWATANTALMRMTATRHWTTVVVV